MTIFMKLKLFNVKEKQLRMNQVNYNIKKSVKYKMQ
jgi:hypothetical protein